MGPRRSSKIGSPTCQPSPLVTTTARNRLGCEKWRTQVAMVSARACGLSLPLRSHNSFHLSAFSNSPSKDSMISNFMVLGIPVANSLVFPRAALDAARGGSIGRCDLHGSTRNLVLKTRSSGGVGSFCGSLADQKRIASEANNPDEPRRKPRMNFTCSEIADFESTDGDSRIVLARGLIERTRGKNGASPERISRGCFPATLHQEGSRRRGSASDRIPTDLESRVVRHDWREQGWAEPKSSVGSNANRRRLPCRLRSKGYRFPEPFVGRWPAGQPFVHAGSRPPSRRTQDSHLAENT